MWSETFTGQAAQDMFRYLKSTYGNKNSEDPPKNKQESPNEQDEVTVKPKNENGVHMMEFKKNGESYQFNNYGNPIYAKENKIENYLYYLKHPEKFIDENGNPIPFGDIFKSEKKIRSELAEDILLGVLDVLAKGKFESEDTGDPLRENRRSKYAPLFPSNKSEFAPTKAEERLRQLYQIELKLSPAQRSPEFSILEKQFSGKK